MTLDQALRIYHLIWLKGEPISGFRTAQLAMFERFGKTPKTWTIATGNGEGWGGDKAKQDRVAEQEFLECLMQAGAGETPPGSGNYPPGLICLVEGLRLGAHVQAAAMKVISGDGRCVFIASGDPPPEFLTDYLKVIELDYTTLEDDLKNLCTDNQRQFRGEFVSPLLGLRPYRSASIMAEALALEDSGKEEHYLYASRGSAIRQDSNEILTYLEPQITFADLIGLDRAKRLLTALANRDKSKSVRGVMFIGGPGLGKTMLALAAAGEFKQPLYILDVGAMFNALVGESESRARRAISVLKRVPPGLVLQDELEKSLSGSKQGMETSSTFTRVGMYFLKYMESPEAQGGYHVILGTSNDIFSLPPEFTRPGRWDAVFAFLRPRPAQLRKVLTMYRKKYELPKEFGDKVELSGLTPADVEATCRIASILQTSEWNDAVQYVPITSRFRPDDIKRMEDECLGRAVSADDDDPIKTLKDAEAKVSRKVRS